MDTRGTTGQGAGNGAGDDPVAPGVPGSLENHVLGHCKLIRKLGQGGMGAVWLARHETLDKDVAVKVLPPGFVADSEAVARFLREARSAARLEHPNVVQVLDAGSQDGIHFIVMQLVDGTDLEKLLKKKGRFPVADTLAVAKRVALALGAAHAIKLVHRDIKPANIMITKPGRVMVTDFGLAREISGDAGITAAGEAMGTPHYIAPEQARGDAVDARADLYSLGITLYALLTGKPPYTGKSPVSIVTKHVDPNERPRPLREVQPDVPPEVEALVHKLMEKDPADRFQSAAELVAAIDRIKGGAASMVRDRMPAKKVALIGAGALAGVLLAAGLAVAIFAPGPAERAYRQAASAKTETEKLAVYDDVAAKYPGTSWAEEARTQAASLRKSMFERELTAVKVAGLEGKSPMADVVRRLDALRAAYPKDGKAVDAVEVALHRARVVARTRDFGEALRTHKPEDKGERFKDFIAPEAFRKAGEFWVMIAVRAALGAIAGAGVRIDEFEVAPDRVTVERRKEAVVPVRAVSIVAKSRERTTHKLTIHWTWQDGDWYLADKGIQEEK